MASAPDEAELSIGSRALDAYSRLSYTMWFALAEFVDNSTQSRLNYESLLEDILKQEGSPLTVEIIHDRNAKLLSIEDNSIGMSKEALIAALKIASPTKDSKGRSKYGMGMKTSACWIGRQWSVITTEFGSGEEWTAYVDVDEIAATGAKVPLTCQAVPREAHGTKIVITGLRRVIQKRTEEVIKAYLGSMYMFDIRPDANGEVKLKLTYGGDEIVPPGESDWDTDPAGAPMMRNLPTLELDGKTVSGWIGVLKKGGRKYGGFSLFQNLRQIQGFPNAWKPRAIFGGVDDEGANNLVAQRLTGVLLLDGFIVSHTKDAILFENTEEDIVERYLVEQTRDFREYATKRRGARQTVWSKEKVRDLIESMRPEFQSGEMRDALDNAILPPPETIEANNQQQVLSLTKEDEIARLNVLPELTVIVSQTDRSEWDPYVIFAPSAEIGKLHVIINGLHPYYQSLLTTDAIEECVHQYIYDAVAEFKVERLNSPRNPNSVRRIKNELLRAQTFKVDNTADEARRKAEEDLFADDQPDV